jgi:hypothetical protein
MLGQYARMTSAALDKVDTPTADCHILDRTTNNLVIADVNTARFKLADRATDLDTMFMHSRVWLDLTADAAATYKIDVFGGEVLNNGRTRGIFGIRNFVISDLATNTGFGSGTTTDDRYHSILSGPGAVQLSFQKMLRGEEDVDITPASSVVNIKVSMDYILHPRGIKWTGGANPTDANYGSNANWDEGYNDHRQVRLVKVISHASTTA